MLDAQVCRQHPQAIVVFASRNDSGAPAVCPLCACIELLALQDKELAAARKPQKEGLDGERHSADAVG